MQNDDALRSELLSLGDDEAMPVETPKSWPETPALSPAAAPGPANVEPSAAPIIDQAVNEFAARSTLDEIGSIFGAARQKVRGYLGLPENDEDQPATWEMLNPAASGLLEWGAQRALQGAKLPEGARGLIRGIQQTKKPVGEGIEQFGKTIGSDTIASYGSGLAKEGEKVAENPFLKPTVESFRGIRSESWIGDTASYLEGKLAEGIGNMGSIAAMYGVGGAAGAAGFLYTMSVGEIRGGLKEAGITDEATIAPYAYGAGAVVAALESVFPAHVLKQLTTPAKQALAKHVAGTFIRGSYGGAWREGLTEALQEATQIAAVAHAKDAKSLFDSKPVIDALSSGESIDRIIEAAISGALPGGALGGFTAGVRAVPGRNQPAQDTGQAEPAAEQAAPGAPAAAAPTVDIAPSIDPTIPAGRGPAIQRAAEPDPVLDDIRAVIEGVQTSAPVEAEASQASLVIPTWNEIYQAIPKDENGYPDVVGLVSRMQELGATSWNKLTDQQKSDLYREFRPVAEQAAAAIEAAPAEVRDVAQQIAEAVAPAGLGVETGGRAAAPRVAQAVDASPAAAAQDAAPMAPTAPADVAAPTDAMRTEFSRVLASKTRRSDWAASVGANQAQLDSLVREALADGRLRPDKNGRPIRTKKAAQAAPTQTAQAKSAAPDEVAVATDAIQPTGAVRQPMAVVTPDGSMQVEAIPTLVELDDLKAASGALQPRDRSRAESDVAIRQIASNLDPAQLMPGRVSDSGAPVVSADGTVISGNGRVGAIRTAYSDPALADRAAAYRAALGPEAAAMRQPVMVMRLPETTAQEELERFADLSNRSRIAAMSATERAQRDARAIGPDTMGLYVGGSFTAPANQEFFRAFTNRLTAAERGAFSRDGVLTKEGEDRMAAAVLAAAYGDPDMLARMLESTDDNIRSITGAMRDAAGAFIRMKAAIASGEASPRFDITRQVAETAKRIADLRDRGIAVRTFLDQIDAFSQVDPLVEALMIAFYNDAMTRPVGRDKMTEILVRYANEASQHRDGGLFEDTTSPKDVIATARSRALVAERQAQDQRNLFDAGPQLVGGDTAGAGREGRGQVGDGSGASPGETGRRVDQPPDDTAQAEGTEGRVNPAPSDSGGAVTQPRPAGARPATMDRSAEVRLDAVKSDVARRYAKRLIESGSDMDAVEATIRAMQQNKKVGKGVLAEVVRAYGGVRGTPKSARSAYGMIRSIAAQRSVEGTDANSQPIREDEGTVPERGVPAGVRADEEIGQPAEAFDAGGVGSGGSLGDAGVADADQPRPSGELLGSGQGGRSDPGVGTRDDQQRPDPGAADGVGPSEAWAPADEDLQAIREQIAADKAREEVEREERLLRNYRITDEDAIGSGGPKAKVRANLDAIETLKQIEAENRPATEEEKKALVKYVGWGAFSQDVFASYKPEWAKERARLQNLLSPEEYAAARASTINAHYTSPDVIKGMWSALEHLGFKGGRVLEPAAGVGHFIGLQPEAMRESSRWTAVELDPTSARITKALYGAADVRQGGFEAQVWPDDHFDLAISNVPFDRTGPYDPRYKQNFSLHDYFFVKALDKVRPGGIVAFITSSYSMDKERDVARREMEKRGTFLGAIRLPGGNQGAFKANAGTDVTTDIIFFRKRLSGEPTETNAEWRDLVEIKTPDKTQQNPSGTTKINGYFAANPDMMLGKMRLIGSMYSKGEPVLIGPTANLDQRIAEVAQNLPANAMLPAETSGASLAQDVDTDVDGIKEGAFYEKDGTIYRRVTGVGQPQKLNKANADRVRLFMGMRDLVDELFAIQGGKQVAAGRKEAIRAALNEAYDAFVEKFGPINLTNVSERVDKAGRTITTRRAPNFAAFEEDPSAYKVAMIEVYDEKTGTARKAAIMSEDVIGTYERPKITGPSDALAVSLNETGRVDMKLISEQMGVSQEEAAAILGDAVFLNPKGEQWQTAAQYLAGDVVQKLEDARAAASLDGGERYARNVGALEKVQPEPLTRVEITIPFGASWVPIEVYNEFVTEIIGAKNLSVTLNETTKQWRVQSTGFRGDNSADAEWGTERKSVASILEATLNSKPIEVWDETGDGERVRNIEAEELARAKGTRMREAFSGQIFPGAQAAIGGWVWENEERAQRLESLYNITFNRIVKEQHDGSHLTFPGLARVVSFPDGSTGKINLTPARVNAIWRIIQNGNTLIDHVVGAGKTWTSIMAVMEMKRLGQIRRPMFVVPNHMLHQFSHEFLQAYPAAKLLVADKDSMSAAKRKEFAAKAAAEKWDGIIITHSAFTRLRMQDQAYRDYYQEAIDEMVEAKEQAGREEGAKSPTVKDIEKAIKSLRAKLDKLTKKENKDEGITFEELGVDHLTVDEAHKFKKLWFQTRHSRVRGIPKQESQRATDLYIKIRYLEKARPGRSALFLTGTPLSNTMAEVYVMMKYLQHDTLAEYGIEKFDAWAQTFGLIDSKTELAPNGRDFRDASSFSKFVNIPELSTLYGRIADTQTAESLKLPRPTLKGGKSIVVKSRLSDSEESFVQSLIQNMDSLKGKKPEKGDPNFLSLFTQGLQVGTDFRLVDPKAPANPDGKIAKAVENIARIWKDGGADPSSPNKAQLVFLDMGVPGSKGKASVSLPSQSTGDELTDEIEALRKKIADEYEATAEADETDDAAESGGDTSSEDALAKAMLVGKFNLYADLKTKLVAAGIPAEQIAFIHDAKNDDQKAKLFEKVRNGDVRVLVGSSEKMGVGTNVQKRLAAMHHIDAPWTPADVEQRDGRILRQGNLNKEVEIYRYITERSFDAYRWQILETKSNFIAQFRAGARGVRIAEEIDAPLPDAADLKAAATGDPRIIEHAEVSREVRSLQAQASAHAGSARRAASQLVATKAELAKAQRFVEPYAMDALRVTDMSGDNFKIQVDRRGGGKTEVTKRKQAGEALRSYILSLSQNAWYAREMEIEFGTISGFDLTGTVKKTPDGTEVAAMIRGTESYSGQPFLINAETDPVQLIRRWEGLVRDMPRYHEAVLARISQYEAEIPRLESIASGTAFPKQAELERALKRQGDLERALRAAPSGSPQAARPWPKMGEPVRVRDLDADEWKYLKQSLKDSQPFDTVDDMLKLASVSHEQLGDAGEAIAKATGATYKRAPLKRAARIVEKLDGRSPRNITDAARGGFDVGSVAQADEIVAALADRFAIVDEGWALTSAGYFDRKVMVLFENGVVGEIQMWSPGMFDAKGNGGHKLYEEARAPDTPAERKKELERQMEALYSATLMQSGRDFHDLVVSLRSASTMSASGNILTSSARDISGASRSGVPRSDLLPPTTQDPSRSRLTAVSPLTTAGAPSQEKYLSSISTSSAEDMGIRGDDVNKVDPALSAADVVASTLRTHESIARRIRSGKRVPISADVTNAFLASAVPHMALVPRGTKVAALTALRPPTEAERARSPWAEVMGEFRSLDGSTFATPFRFRVLPDLRAAFDRNNKAIIFVGVGRSDIEQASNVTGQGSRIRHEAVHAVWNYLGRSVKSRLARHADVLGVLDMQLGTVLKAIGEKTYNVPDEQRTLRDLYSELYATAPDKNDRLAQEAVAHLRELSAAGFFLPMELEAIQQDMDLLDDAQALGSTEMSELPPELDAAIRQSGERSALARHFGATRIEDIGPEDPHPGRVLAFHGTDRDLAGGRFDPDYSSDFGIHFGSAEQANARSTPGASLDVADDGGRNFPVVLDLGNVLDLPDLGQWDALETAGAAERAMPELAGLRQRVADASSDMAAPVELADETLRRGLTEAGIDAIRYRNATEGDGWSYIVWEPGKVISATSGETLFAVGSRPDEPATPSLNGVIQKLQSAVDAVPTQTLMGVTIRADDGSEVRLNPRANVRGQTDMRTGAIATRRSRDIDVKAHEIAHRLEVMLGSDILDFQAANAEALEAFAPGRTPSEQWAEWFSAYITDGDGIRERMPDLTEAFEDAMEAGNADLLTDLQEVQELYRRWIARATPEEMASDVVSTYAGNSFADLAEGDRSLGETIAGKMAGAYTAIIDDMSPIQRMVRKLLETADQNGVRDADGRLVSLSVAQNPYKIARMFRGYYATGYSWLKHGIANRGEATPTFSGLFQALETLFGSSDQKQWDQGVYQAAGNYLIAQRAVAEYEALERKEQRLEQIDGLIGQANAAAGRVNAGRRQAEERIERRQTTLTRSETLLRDRRRSLREAEAEIARLQERIQEKKDDVLAAQMARSESLAARRQRDLSALERQSAGIVRDADALRYEVDTLSLDVSLLSAEIEQLSGNVAAAEEQARAIEDAQARLRRERDATAKRGASRPPTKETKEHWLDVIARTEADPKYARVREFANQVHDFSHGLLTIRHQAGLVPDELYQELSKRKNWYVPFQRDMSDASVESVFGGSGMKKWSPFKKFDGSDRAIMNPLETLAADAYATAQQIAFNDAAGSLASLSERAGPGAADIVQVLSREESAEANAATFDRVKDIAMSMGIDEADALRIVHQMEQDYAGGQLSLFWSPATQGPTSLPTIPLYRNGERIMVRLTDPEFGSDVFNALSGLGKEWSDFAINFLATPARLLQMGITTHPTFMPRNLFRDIFDAWIKTGALPISTQVTGARMMRDPEFMRRYYEAGGIVGGRNVAALTSKEQQVKVLDLSESRVSRGSIVLGAIGGGLLGTLYGGPIGGAVGAMLGGYALRRGEVLKAVEAVETMTRVGVASHAYRRAMLHNPGLSETEAMLEAAFVARDTFDWNRRGSKMLTVTRLVTFLNAQIQGMDSSIRRLGGESDRGMALSKQLGTVWRRETGGELSRDEERALGDAYKTWARMGIYTAGLLALYALATSGGDDDDRDRTYQDIRDKTKATHSWMPNVFGVDVRLPKAFEWAMPANVIEAIADKIRGRDPNAWDRIVDATYEVIAPPLVPQAMNLIVGLSTNAQIENLAPWVKRLLGRGAETASNREIVSDTLARLDPEAQFDAFSSQLAIDIAKGMSAVGLPRDMVMSPKKIDFILRSGGYWGQDLARGYNILREGFGGRPREAPRVSDLPVIGGFTGVAARQSRSRDQLFGLMSQSGGRLATAAATYKQLIDEEGVPAEAERFLSRLEPEERAYALLKYYGAPSQIKDHPLERLLSVDRVLSRIRKDMILDRLTPVHKDGRKTVREFDSKITLSPRKQTEVHEIVERLQQAEAWNSMVLMKRPGWEGRSEIAVKPILDELKASSRAVFDLYEDRLLAARAREFSDVKQDWPELRGRILREGVNAF